MYRDLNHKKTLQASLEIQNLKLPFNSYIFSRWLIQSPVANSRFTTKRASLSVVIYTIFTFRNALYPPLHITPVEIRDMCTIPRSILTFCSLYGSCGSADFYPFNNTGLSSSINPYNIFGVLSYPPPCVSSVQKLLPGATLSTMKVLF